MASDPVQAMKKIEAFGNYLDHTENRVRLLKVGLQAPIDEKADNIILTGCHPLYSLAPVESVNRLFTRLGVSFTFLAREHCCGHQPLKQLHDLSKNPAPAEVKKYDAFARRSESDNVEQARKLGASSMVTICAGCNTMWNRLSQNDGLRVRHYLDLLLEVYPSTRLEGQVDFFEGCHKIHAFVPDFQKSIPETSKMVLARLEGLKVNTVPNICCRVAAEKVLAMSKTGVIVTPSACCYSTLIRARRGNSPRIRFLAELLNEALDAQAG